MNHSEIPEQEVARYCDENANLWPDHVRKGWDVYREYFNNPAFFEFIGDLSGKTVLDAGCGEGHNTRLLARSGARMTGVDISQRMIELARREEQREPLGIRYEVASFSDLSVLDDVSFDVVVSSMALMDGLTSTAPSKRFSACCGQAASSIPLIVQYEVSFPNEAEHE